MKTKLYPKIDAVIAGFKVIEISEERQQLLQSLIDFIQEKKDANKEIRLNFVCTHN